MSGRSENGDSVYTVDELTQVLGVTEPEVATILEEQSIASPRKLSPW